MPLTTSLAVNSPSSLAICECSMICKSRSPNSSRIESKSPESSAAMASYDSSNRCLRSESCVCSLSHGQPFGARRCATISWNDSNDVPSSNAGRYKQVVCEKYWSRFFSSARPTRLKVTKFFSSMLCTVVMRLTKKTSCSTGYTASKTFFNCKATSRESKPVINAGISGGKGGTCADERVGASSRINFEGGEICKASNTDATSEKSMKVSFKMVIGNS